MSSSESGANAYNPGVLVNGKTVDVKPPRTSQQQAYLNQVAEDAEAAVAVVEQQIAGLKESLTDRKAEAERARAEAENGEN